MKRIFRVHLKTRLNFAFWSYGLPQLYMLSGPKIGNDRNS